MIAEGEKVVIKGTSSAILINDRGEWLGMAPIGERVGGTIISILRVEEGKIAEMWDADMAQSEQSLSSTQLVGERSTSENPLPRTPVNRASAREGSLGGIMLS
jgi:hypothetical protein